MSYPVFYVPAGDVLPVPFATYGGTNGESITASGLAVTDIEIYRDGSTTQRASDAGYTLLDTDGLDFDGLTGIHGFSIDTGDDTDSGFFAVGSWFTVVVSAITVDSQTVSFIACQFRLMPAESVAGTPKVDAAAISGDSGAADALEAMVDGTDGPVPLLGIVDQGTAQSATGTTLVLRSGAAFADDALIGCTVGVHGSTQGYWQFREITDNTLADDTVTVDSWAVTPTGTITYKIYAGSPALATPTQVALVDDAITAAKYDQSTAFPLTASDGSGLTAINLPDQTMNITGNVTGNLSGSVGSVTGAVGSVTGNVGGNVAGSVGSVTGNVGGNVTGSVGSVTAAVTLPSIPAGWITAAGIATDAIDADALAADAIAEINATVDTALADYDGPTKAELDAAVANVSVDEIQATALADLFNTDSGTTYASAVAGSVVKQIADNAGGSALTTDAIAEAMFTYAATATYATADANSVVKQIADNAGGSALTEAGIADAVLDELLAGHTTAGSLGKAIADVLEDTGTTLPGTLTTIGGNVTDILADTGTDGVKLDPAQDWGGIYTNGTTGAAIQSVAVHLVNVHDATTSLSYGNAALKTALDAVLADTGTDGVVLASATCNKIADHVRRRTQANVEASSDGDTLGLSSLYGFIQQAQESAVAGTTLTVYRTDGATPLGTKTLTTDADADPVTGVS